MKPSKRPPTAADLADECGRTARRAEELAKKAATDSERAAFEKIASEWRVLEEVARQSGGGRASPSRRNASLPQAR